MSRCIVSPEALADLEEVGDWIARDNPTRAASFLTELSEHFVRLGLQPMTGRNRDDLAQGLRSMSHGNYVIFYLPTDSGIIVARVLHGRRDLEHVLQSEIHPAEAQPELEQDDDLSL